MPIKSGDFPVRNLLDDVGLPEVLRAHPHLLGPMGTAASRLRARRLRAERWPVQLPGKRAPQAERSDGEAAVVPGPLETFGDVEAAAGSGEVSESADSF